jgi:ADP-ribose pyrophosphatase
MGRSPIYQGRIVDLGLEDVVLPNGAKVELEVIRHRGAAAIVPLHDDRTVTLVHQFRHAAGGMIWEVPAGVLDGGEAPETCAARELREEVQLEARTFTPLGSILTTPGFTDERIHLFLAQGLTAAAGAPEADEYIEVVRMPFDQALAWIADGTIADAKTICALHLAERVRR